MRGKITKIDPLKESRNPNEAFQRVHIRLDDGRWSHTDLVPTFRNFKNWKSHLKVGKKIGGLRYVDPYQSKIDADSLIYEVLEGDELLKLAL